MSTQRQRSLPDLWLVLLLFLLLLTGAAPTNAVLNNLLTAVSSPSSSAATAAAAAATPSSSLLRQTYSNSYDDDNDDYPFDDDDDDDDAASSNHRRWGFWSRLRHDHRNRHSQARDSQRKNNNKMMQCSLVQTEIVQLQWDINEDRFRRVFVPWGVGGGVPRSGGDTAVESSFQADTGPQALPEDIQHITTINPHDIVWVRECWCARMRPTSPSPSTNSLVAGSPAATSNNNNNNKNHHVTTAPDDDRQYCLAEYNLCQVTIEVDSNGIHQRPTISCFVDSLGETQIVRRVLWPLGLFWMIMCLFLLVCTEPGDLSRSYVKRCCLVGWFEATRKIKKFCFEMKNMEWSSPLQREDSFPDIERVEGFDEEDQDSSLGGADTEALQDNASEYSTLGAVPRDNPEDVPVNPSENGSSVVELVPITRSRHDDDDDDDDDDAPNGISSASTRPIRLVSAEEIESVPNFRLLLSEFYDRNNRCPDFSTELWKSAVRRDPALLEFVRTGQRRMTVRANGTPQRPLPLPLSPILPPHIQSGTLLHLKTKRYRKMMSRNDRNFKNGQHTINDTTAKPMLELHNNTLESSRDETIRLTDENELEMTSCSDSSTTAMSSIDQSSPSRSQCKNSTKNVLEDDEPSHVADETTCSICLCDIEDGHIVGDLPCGHLLHKECLKAWLQRNNRCPLCQEQGMATPKSMLTVGTAFGIETINILHPSHHR